jgi:hypothetical protein
MITISEAVPNERKRSYVYVIFRTNGIPCYVGQGVGDRYKRHGYNKNSRNKHLAAIYKNATSPLPVKKIKENLTRDEAIELEEFLISVIGREKNGGPLVNCTDGGEGSLGWEAPKEWKEHRSMEATRLWKDPKYRAVMLREGRKYGSGNKQPRSEEFKKVVSEKLRGNKHTLGMKHSDEAKRKMSEYRKGRKQSPEHVAKRIEAMKRTVAAKKVAQAKVS